MTTKNIIPQADGEGSIGIDGTSWASGVFNTGVFEEIFVGGNGAATLPGSKLEIVDSNNHLNLKVADTISQSVLKFSDVDGLGAAINYDHNADKLYLITDGTAIPANGALSIDSDGNVGIGTTDPDYKLHIVDSTNDGSGGIKVENYKPVIELSDSTTNATATTLTQDNSAFTIANNSVDSLTIDSAGKVGIGTTDPGAKLDLQTSDHPLYIRSGAGANDNLFLFENPAAGPQFRMYEKGTSNVAVKLSTHNDSYFNGGKVGIGTTRPGKKLHVAGDSHHIVIEDTNAVAGKKMRGIYNNNQKLYIGRYTDDFNSFYDDMVIDSAGKVGIGTTSPSAKLDVQGDISISGAIVSSDSDGRVVFSDQGLMVGQAEVKPDPDNPTSIYFESIPQVQDSEGNAVTILTADKLGLGTSTVLNQSEQDLQFKLLTDQKRFVVGTSGNAENTIASGWYRFNDFQVKGATDIGFHSINPVDTRIYSDETSFILFKTDTAGNRVAHLVGGNEEVSPNNAIALGIAVKVDSAEFPEDIEFVHTDGESYSVINGNSDSLGSNGLPLRQGFQSPSLGSTPSPLLIDGGSF